MLEVGASSFGAEEVQAFGLKRTVDLLRGQVERIHWYSLFDLPATWPAETRHKEAEGSSYYWHYKQPLIFEDGEQMRDFVHVTDIVRANMLAMESVASNGHVINVGCGRPITIRKVAEMLAQSLGKDAQFSFWTVAMPSRISVCSG